MKTIISANQNLTFEVIKKNLHNRRYRRLDVFQEHMFQVFEDARNKNRTDSEVRSISKIDSFNLLHNITVSGRFAMATCVKMPQGLFSQHFLCEVVDV